MFRTLRNLGAKSSAAKKAAAATKKKANNKKKPVRKSGADAHPPVQPEMPRQTAEAERANVNPASEAKKSLTELVAIAAKEHADIRDAFKTSLLEEIEADPSTAANAPRPDEQPWIDDTLPAQVAKHANVYSDAYKELHRRHMTNADMGLFGGEAGFEKSPRVWVDPDRPHVKSVYTSALLNANLRYTRYGYFKKELAIIDVNKLVTHARMLPAPMKLLTDFIVMRVALPDASCAAILRHATSYLKRCEAADLPHEFGRTQEVFERLLVTNIPPADVGVESHAEMITACAVAGRWDVGFEQVHFRFMELVNEGKVEATAKYYDALMYLCSRCEGHAAQARQILREFLALNVRPLPSMLTRLHQVLQPACLAAARAGDEDLLAELNAEGEEAHSLFEYFMLQKSTESVREFVGFCACAGNPSAALKTIGEADMQETKIDERTISWLLYGFRNKPKFGVSMALDMLRQMPLRGLSATYETFVFALLPCALQGDGEAALRIAVDHIGRSPTQWTPELGVLAVQAFANEKAPTALMVDCADMILSKLLNAVTTEHSLLPATLGHYFALIAAAGRPERGFSQLKLVLSVGLDIDASHCTALMFANVNAVAPLGSKSVTSEILSLVRASSIKPTRGLAYATATAIATHGCTDAIKTLGVAAGLPKEVFGFKASGKRSSGGGMESAIDRMRSDAKWIKSLEKALATLPEDIPLPVFEPSPLELRQLKTDLQFDPREMGLKKLGSGFSPRGMEKLSFGAVKHKVYPFSADERSFREVRATT